MKISWWDLGARVLVAVLGVAAIVAGCGGGVGEGGTGNGYTQGTISGFGSIFVNDVRFDDSSASVQDADGNPRTRDDLKLGMSVEVESGVIDAASATATAAKIRFGSELLGPVATVDAANGLLTMLGQTVQVGAQTVFDESLAGGLAAVTAGDLLEVYASFDPATGRYRATRIDPHGAGPDPYRLRGIVASLDSGNQRLTIGAAQFDYADAGGVPAGLGAGSYVRLTIAKAAANTSRWTVTAFGTGTPSLPDSDESKLRGYVTSVSAPKLFSVNGVPVDAAGAEFPDGSAISVGLRVEVEGPVRSGTVKATRVSIRTDSEESQHEFELDGSITAIDTASQTFVLRGVTVSYANNPRVDQGKTVADLAVGQKVEVQGVLSSDGTRLEATRISFDD